MSTQKKASDLFVECLEREHVTHVFGVPGEENLDLMESLRTSSIQLVVTRHEQHAAFMAATFGRLTGEAGVCLSTLGPGATNLITGIAHAQLGGMPLVAITGQKPLRDNWQGAFQLLDVVNLIRPVTKWNDTIHSASTIPRMVRHAFQVAEHERPGATHLELPEDVARERVIGTPHFHSRPCRPIANPEAIDRVCKRIKEAHLPILLLSAGANRKQVGDALLKFMDSTGIHALTTQMGKGVIPEDHDCSLFSLGIHKKDYVHAAIEAADLVLTVGYDIREYPPAVWNRDKSKPIVHIDFSPAVPDEYYDPQLELIGDISHSIEAIRLGLTDAQFNPLEHQKLRTDILTKFKEFSVEEVFPPRPRNIVFAVRDVLDRKDIVCLDNGIYKLWFARLYPAYSENTVLLDNALATMGAGLGMAMAAKMIHPDCRVLAVCGDGGFMMNSQDLETAVRLNLDIPILLLRDNAYGFIRWKQKDLELPDFGLQFGNPDFVQYAKAYGAHALRVEKKSPLGPTLERAFSMKGPVLIDCPIDYSDNDELLGSLML